MAYPINNNRGAKNLADFAAYLKTVIAGETEWGEISGDIADQDDLATALAGKSDTGHTHTKSDITDFAHTHGSITNDGKLGTASRVVVTNSSKVIGVSSITSTKLGYLTDVTSNIQAQINGKAASSHTHAKSDITGLTDVIGDTTQLPTPADGLSENIADVADTLETLDGNVVHKSGNESITGFKTFTNHITLGPNKWIKNTNDASNIKVQGGLDDTSSHLVLHGKNNGANAGSFSLTAQTDTTHKVSLIGRPDGSLTWKGDEVLTEATGALASHTHSGYLPLSGGTMTGSLATPVLTIDGHNGEAVVASGNNYIRYASGLQICWDRKSLDVNINEPWESLYETEDILSSSQFNYPVAFISTPSLQATIDSSGAALIESTYVTNTFGSVRWLCRGSSMTSLSVVICYTAIGKWK